MSVMTRYMLVASPCVDFAVLICWSFNGDLFLNCFCCFFFNYFYDRLKNILTYGYDIKTKGL